MTPVLICGAGPVGLTLALGLAAWGVPSTVVERHRAPLPFPKGRALSIRTMEIFRQLGLEPELTRMGLPRAETMHFLYGETLAAERYTRISNVPPPDGSPLSPTFTLACSQDVLEAILRRHADAHPLVEAIYGLTVVDASIGDAGASVVAVDDAGGRHDLEGRWLVAADGAHSTLRALARIPRASHGPGCPNVNILFEADLADLVADRPSLVATISNDHVHATILTVDGHRRWLCNVIRPDVPDPAVAAADHGWCRTQVHHALGREVALDVVAAMPWDATAANAERYRDRSLLLVGDAAHVATPYGGFGMNCGIADVHNMAWKLAAHLQHGAPDALLDTYDDERRLVGERTVRESALRLEAALAAHGDGRTRRGDVRPNPSDGLVLGGVYRSDAVFGPREAHPDDDSIGTYVPSARPGARAPHAWLADGRSTLDLYGPHLTVVHHPDTAAPSSSSLDPLGALPVVTIPFDRAIDPDGDARRLYGIDDGGAVVVRPDGHVAARIDG